MKGPGIVGLRRVAAARVQCRCERRLVHERRPPRMMLQRSGSSTRALLLSQALRKQRLDPLWLMVLSTTRHAPTPRSLLQSRTGGHVVRRSHGHCGFCSGHTVGRCRTPRPRTQSAKKSESRAACNSSRSDLGRIREASVRLAVRRGLPLGHTSSRDRCTRPSAAQDQVDHPYCLGEAVLAGQAGLYGDGVAAVTVVAQQCAQFAGEVLGALAAPRESAGYAEPGHPDRGLGLVKASRDHHLRQSGPEQRDRCPDPAVVDGGLAAGRDPGQRGERGAEDPGIDG